MFLALLSPVAVGPLVPGSADVIEPRPTDRNTVVQKWVNRSAAENPAGLCCRRVYVCTVHGNLPLTAYQAKRGRRQWKRGSVSNTDVQPEHGPFKSRCNIGRWTRPSACLCVELASSHCFSAFRFQIASIWTTRNPVMSFINYDV